MRIRKPFAGAFIGLCLVAGLAGFSPQQYELPKYKQSDKVLHFLAFFLLTFAFYWILETNRRKVLQVTFTVCTVGLGFASEIVQGLLPNDREFDYYDILANVLGSISALVLCNWYHKRMLERKRAARGYSAVAGEDERDVELGEDFEGQELGVVRPTVEEELEQWDENAEDWDDTEPAEPGNGDIGEETKKRGD
ncbi:hypothetical protein B0J11DRAFT_421789 [Dendryphion nanum]|uniref:VanZ-like domain-containing protein n=1 Tax=Dendryphion nanum TaxID=256645 RepID=A0A9P9EIF6_9PLEO|nr:hypothetical protein B0J11DRAFT_421789 [Dendryphion nanum]